MKKQTVIILIAVLVVIITGGIIFYFMNKRKTTSKQAQKNIQNTPDTKPYDNEFKRLADAFFSSSELGPEQEAALYEDMQNRFMSAGEGKVDAFVKTVANWTPTWLQDPALEAKKEKIKSAWDNLYKEYSSLKAKSFKS